MKIRIFDGRDTIGGNKIYVEENGEGIFLDFGMNFAKYSQFYAGFMRERSSRGIYDLWVLGIIPRVKIYRSDLVPPDLKISEYEELNVKAVVLSHAHMDHAGNVGLLHERISVVLSPKSLAILKANREKNGMSLGEEFPYYSPKETLEGTSSLKPSKFNKYVGRRIVLTHPCEELEEIIFERPKKGKRAKKVQGGEVSHLEEEDLGFEVKPFEVDHSIPGSLAFIIEGDSSIAYSGDFRFSGERRKFTENFFSEARDCEILIVEGTRMGGEGRNATERDVYERALEIIEKVRGIVVVSFPEKNLERLRTFEEIAEKTGREVVITEREAYSLYYLEKAGEQISWKKLRILKVISSHERSWKKELREKIPEENFVEVKYLRENQEQEILCLSMYDLPCLLDLLPCRGAYIYASSEAFEEEQKYDFIRLYNWIRHLGLKLYGFRITKKKKEPKFDEKLHASGHASEEELIRAVEKADPDKIIPVHTNHPEKFFELFGEERVILEERYVI